MIRLLLAISLLYSWFRYSNGAEYIDLSYPINNDTVYRPGHRKYQRLIDTEATSENGVWFATYSMTISEHTATHIDAPYHVFQSGWKLDEIPTNSLISVPAVMVDVSDKVTTADGINYNYAITKLDFLEWELEHGIIPQGCVVLVHTGWGERWPDEDEYVGEDRFGNLNYPGFDASGAKFLAAERNVIGVGIDSLSIDPGYSKILPAHSHFGSRNIYMLENVANLHLIPPRGVKLWVMPMKLEHATGAPIRLVAYVP